MPGLPKIYKRYQGRYTRSITTAALATILFAVCYFVSAMLVKYIPTQKVERIPVVNATDSMVFAKPWPNDAEPKYKVGATATEGARKALHDAGVEKWEFRSAYPVPYALYISYGVPSLLFVLGAWGIFKLVNRQRFADFLIATEGEMKKVSWSSRAELVGSTVVVIVTVLILAVLIYIADFVWTFAFVKIGALPGH